VIGRFALIFLLSFSCFSQEKLLVKDRALFRIEKQVFFKEAFSVWLKDWSQLKCLGRSSFLLRSMGISSKDFQLMNETLDVAESRNLTESEKNSIERGITLVKFILYGQTQNIQADTKLPSSFSCLENKKSPPIELVVRAEVLLRNKFKSDATKRDKEDKKRAKAFIESINKAKNHEVYL